MAQAIEVDYGDIQGLARFGHGRLEEACYLLLRVADRDAAREWLRTAPVTTAVTMSPPPDTALQVAFTSQGLAALGVAGRRDRRLLRRVPHRHGGGAQPLATARRRRRQCTRERGPGAARSERTPHLLVMLFAREGKLEAWERQVTGRGWDTRLRRRSARLSTLRHRPDRAVRLRGRHQPAADRLELRADARRARPARVRQRAGAGRGAAGLSQRVRAAHRAAACSTRPSMPRPRTCRLPWTPAHRRDLGRNGSYLVFRQLDQDVPGFWRYVDEQAGHDAQQRRGPGRRHGRAAPGRDAADPADQQADRRHRLQPARARDQRLPLRGRPRRHPLPVRRPHPPRQPAHRRPAGRRAAALAAPAAHAGLQAPGLSRRHGGGDPLPPPGPPRPHLRLGRSRPRRHWQQTAEAAEPRGLHFICLGANISRQFEFVQNAWMMNAKFDGLSRRERPAHRQPRASVRRRPRPTGSACRAPTARRGGIEGLPRFVTVRGGAYFFLPGIRALRYIAEPTAMTVPAGEAGAAGAPPRAAGRAARRAPARAVLPPAAEPGRARAVGRRAAVAAQPAGARTRAWGWPRSASCPTRRTTCSRSSRASPTTCCATTRRVASSAAATPRPTAS